MLAADGAASFSAKEGVKGKGGEGICAGEWEVVHIAFSIKMQGCVVDGTRAARVCRAVW